VIEAVVRVLEIIEPAAPLGAVGIAPARPGPEGIQVEMKRDGSERVGRVIDVLDRLVAGQCVGRLVQPGVDLIDDPLLPVRRGTGGNWELLKEHEGQEGMHGRKIVRAAISRTSPRLHTPARTA
jgi:hypothetical protein